MTSEVPPKFDKPWSLSDVVIHTANSKGKVIYAYKGALAMFSPYFRVLFFGDFKEKNDASVNVECDYDVMVEILRNIHQIDFTYAAAQAPYEDTFIVKLYRAADRFDFAFIRKLCIEQISADASIAMANAAVELELWDIMMTVLTKLNVRQTKEFLFDKDAKYFLNKQEFLTLFKKAVGMSLPKSTEPYDVKPDHPLNLEEITEDLKYSRVDLTRSFPTADLMIITNSAMGRILYANKSVLDMMCPNFGRFLCKTDELHLDGLKRFLARIDEEYAIMKEILFVIHMCNDGEPDRALHPAFLHSMYCAAGKDRLDIRLIRNSCITKLVEHKSIDAFDVLWRLDLNYSMNKLFESLSASQLRDWIYREDEHLSYRKGNEVVAVTIGLKERVLCKDITQLLINKLKMKFFYGI